MFGDRRCICIGETVGMKKGVLRVTCSTGIKCIIFGASIGL